MNERRPSPAAETAVMATKLIASLTGYGIWRLFGGSKDTYPGVVDIFTGELVRDEKDEERP